MKQRYFILIGAILFLMIQGNLAAVVWESEGNGGNIHFSPERDRNQSVFDGTDYWWGVNLRVEETLDELYRFRFEGGKEGLLGYTGEMTFTYLLGTLNFSTGTYFGILNSENAWIVPGFVTRISYISPGFLALSVGLKTLVSRLTQEGDYHHQELDFEAGLYFTNGIVSLNYFQEDLYRMTSDNGYIDFHMKTGLSTEIFQKNLPLRFQAGLSYNLRQREYFGPDALHQIHSLVFSPGIFWEIIPGLSLNMGVDIALGSFVTGLNYNLGPSTILFSARMGLRFEPQPPPTSPVLPTLPEIPLEEDGEEATEESQSPDSP